MAQSNPSTSLPALPETFIAHLGQIARAQFGKAAPEGRLLAAAVREVSRRYTRDRASLSDSLGDPGSLTARLRFYLPRDLLKVWGPLSELHRADALPQRRTLRVLDLGAGLGTTCLGLAAFAAEYGLCDQMHVVAVDSDRAALELMGKVLSSPPGLPIPPLQLHSQQRALAVDSPLPRGPFDVVVCGLALNEILLPLASDARPVAGATFLRRVTSLLDDDGCAIVLEPALRQESRTLSAVRDELAQTPSAPFVFAPCLGTTPCPMLARPRDWCHERLPTTLPGELGKLSTAAGLRGEELTYSYLTLRKRPGSLATLGDATERPYRVVGGPLGSKGKTELMLCGEHDTKKLIRLDRHRDRRNDPLENVGRGTILGLGPIEALPPATDKTLRLTPEIKSRKHQCWEKRADET